MPQATDSRVPALIAAHDLEMANAHDCAARHRRLAKAVDAQQAIAWRWYCAAVATLDITADSCEAPP